MHTRLNEWLSLVSKVNRAVCELDQRNTVLSSTVNITCSLRMVKYNNNDYVTLHNHYDVLAQSSPVCSAHVQFMDLNTGELIAVRGVHIMENSITFMAAHSVAKSHFNITVVATNTRGSQNSQAIISKHFYATV